MKTLSPEVDKPSEENLTIEIPETPTPMITLQLDPETVEILMEDRIATGG